MGYSQGLLEQVRAVVAANDDTLKAAKDRRSNVLDAATRFSGVQEQFVSGSLAHGTANEDLDADCGVVLDRRKYPHLGPDGGGDGPEAVVEHMRQHVREELRGLYPDIKFRVLKRAIQIQFHEPLGNGSDPSVDLIVGLERRDEPGLWIPNTKASRWDPSHPQRHTQLLSGPPKTLRVLRARVVRLTKAWDGQYSQHGLSSFNKEALALYCIEAGMSEPTGLGRFFEFGASDLDKRLTPDPANVSPSLKLPEGADREVVVDRLRSAAELMSRALEHDSDEEAVRAALAELFPKFLPGIPGEQSKAALAAAAASGTGLRFDKDIRVGGTSGAEVKDTRAYGG